MKYLVLLAFSCVAAAAADLTVGTATAAAGQRANGYIEVPAGVDEATRIPVIVINGAKPGPKLALIAGLHGTEYTSIIALEKLPQQVNAADLSGALIILPLINVASFDQKIVHRNPVDKKGINGYPGKADGTQSERIAFALNRDIIEKCDHLIDYHGGDLDENLHPYSYWTKMDDAQLDKRTKEMLFAFGLPTIIMKPNTGRTLDTTALKMGKASITVEAGRAGTTDAADIAVLVNGTLNVMRYLRMLPGQVDMNMKQPLWIAKATVIKSDYDGVFYPLVVPEAYVQKGMAIGYITNHFGEKIYDVTAPFPGVILYVCALPTMKKGDNLVDIGEIAAQPPQ